LLPKNEIEEQALEVGKIHECDGSFMGGKCSKQGGRAQGGPRVWHIRILMTGVTGNNTLNTKEKFRCKEKLYVGNGVVVERSVMSFATTGYQIKQK